MIAETSRKGGFTLLEFVIASAVMALVFAQIASIFIGAQRLAKSCMAETEYAMATRELRDKLLFQATPFDGTHFSGGLLSAERHTVDNNSIKCTLPWENVTSFACGTNSSSVLQLSSRNGERYLNNTADNSSWRWLFPQNIGLGWSAGEWSDSMHGSKGLVDLAQFNASQSAVGMTGAHYYMNIKYSGHGLTRTERVSVPLFGVVQRTESDGETFHDF